jgi:hypothetical protein
MVKISDVNARNWRIFGRIVLARFGKPRLPPSPDVSPDHVTPTKAGDWLERSQYPGTQQRGLATVINSAVHSPQAINLNNAKL